MFQIGEYVTSAKIEEAPRLSIGEVVGSFFDESIGEVVYEAYFGIASEDGRLISEYKESELSKAFWEPPTYEARKCNCE